MVAKQTEVTEEGLLRALVMGLSICEGHEAVVRRELISLGSKLKKERQADFNRVLTALQQAKHWHKHSGRPEALKRLTELRAIFETPRSPNL